MSFLFRYFIILLFVLSAAPASAADDVMFAAESREINCTVRLADGTTRQETITVASPELVKVCEKGQIAFSFQPDIEKLPGEPPEPEPHLQQAGADAP